MIYGYMLESFVEDIKAKSVFSQIEYRLKYFKSNNIKATESNYKELISLLNKINYNNLNNKNKSIYDKLKKDIDLYAATYFKEKEQKEKELARGREETNKFLAKFKDAPEWIYNDDESQDKVIKYINTKVIPTMMTPQFKKMLREVIDKDIANPNGYLNKDVDKEYFTNKNKIPIVKASDFDPGIIEIIQDETQQLCVLVRPYITEPIADIFGANTGDGDEGCIYI